MDTLAIIGTGIAGLGSAHFLHRHYDVTLFEADVQVGGHSRTIDVPEPGGRPAVPVDTGFMVCNRVTYPLLTALFDDLEVALKPAPMSFSVRHAESGLEFCGSSLNLLFAQRRNLLRPSFWRLLRTIDRFNREAIGALADHGESAVTLAEYVRRRNYGEDFLRLYLIPMSSAVWSTPPELMLRFPAATLLRFFHNHGFLGLYTQHPWLTVEGGARTYVNRLIRPFRERILTGDPVAAVRRGPAGVSVVTRRGDTHRFDRAILACHADQALRMLDVPTEEESRILGAFRYFTNTATVHTDPSVMPRTRRAWSSWNYEIGHDGTATHYWMNALQGVSDRENYFVSINRPRAIDRRRVLRTFACEHPLFDLDAIAAQPRLPKLNRDAEGTTETFFAGSYFRYGFHEDAFASAKAISSQLIASGAEGAVARGADPGSDIANRTAA
ncbi:MAG TPA: FAD-dependent oxidoreductase [Opitutaceae bacterium]